MILLLKEKYLLGSHTSHLGHKPSNGAGLSVGKSVGMNSRTFPHFEFNPKKSLKRSANRPGFPHST